MVAENGDAIFLRYSGLVQLTGTTTTCDHRFILIVGKGRFAGATGSGTIKGGADLVKNEGTLTFDGMISRPAAKAQ